MENPIIDFLQRNMALCPPCLVIGCGIKIKIGLKLKKRSVNLNLTAGQCELMKSSESVVTLAILLWKCHLPLHLLVQTLWCDKLKLHSTLLNSNQNHVKV